MGNLDWWFARISSLFRPSLSSISSLSVTKHSAMHGSSCSFYFITTIWPVALDVGYVVGIRKSEVFSRRAINRQGTCVQEIKGTVEVQVFTGGENICWQGHRFLRRFSRMDLLPGSD